MFHLLVLLSMIATNAYEVFAVTLDSSMLTQRGYNNEYMDISFIGYNIDYIDPNAFKGYTKVIALRLSSNQLSKVDLGLFKDMENLVFLDLSYNPLTQLTNLKKIVFSRMQNLILNRCQLTSLDTNVTNAFPNLESFSGNLQIPIKTNQLLTWKNLQTLIISTKNQTSLTKEHFNGLASLKYLSFTNSNIKTIEVHTLLALPNLTNVELVNNEITAFEYLQIPIKLDTLNLGGNKMNYFMLSITMGVIRRLSINSNLFRSFKSMNFTFLANLTHLDLSYNPHAYPNEIAGHMKPLKNLVEVRLDNLSISTLDSNFFKQNVKLENIYLTNNKISVLTYNTFSHLKSLTLLDLKYNQINLIDNRTFIGLNLQYILLAYNNLTKIGPRTFYNLNSLNVLDFTANSISEVDSSAFIGCYNLRNLFLWGNSISKFSPRTFENLTFDNLLLSSNQLTELDNSTFAGVRSLGLLEIRSNKISKIGPGTFYGLNLITLRLEWNLLTELENDTFAGQNQLYSISLNYNKFSSFKPGTFNNLPNLQYIYLDGNNLTQLDNSTFTGCNKLVYISLYYTPNLPKNNIQSLCPTDAVDCKVYY